jgi:hypothetical protein
MQLWTSPQTSKINSLTIVTECKCHYLFFGCIFHKTQVSLFEHYFFSRDNITLSPVGFFYIFFGSTQSNLIAFFPLSEWSFSQVSKDCLQNTRADIQRDIPFMTGSMKTRFWTGLQISLYLPKFLVISWVWNHLRHWWWVFKRISLVKCCSFLARRYFGSDLAK